MRVARARRFQEVKPERSSPAFRAYVGKALEVLRTSKTEVGRATYAYIVSGKVKIDLINDLTRSDYRHVSKDLKPSTVALRPDAYESLGNLKSPASKALDRLLHGYMWDDRIYVAGGVSPQRLAITLVHEVNHVINRSEEHYRGPTQALLQEYRSFYVEKLFAGEKMTPARCKALKAEVAKFYGFTKAQQDRIPDVPPGLLVPPH